MTIPEFQKIYGPKWAEVLKSDMGRAALETLHDARMLPTCDGAEHQAVYRLGGIAGYEQGEKNLISMASAARVPTQGPEQNYGVHEKKSET